MRFDLLLVWSVGRESSLKEKMGEKGEVLEAVLKETVDLVIDQSMSLFGLVAICVSVLLFVFE